MKLYAFHRAGRIALIAGSLLAIGQSASSYAAASAPVVPEGYVYRDQLVANASAHCVSIDFKLLSGKTETRHFVDDSYVVLEAKNLGVHYKTANVTFYKSDTQCSGKCSRPSLTWMSAADSSCFPRATHRRHPQAPGAFATSAQAPVT